MSTTESISAASARRILLRAQGLHRGPSGSGVGIRALRDHVGRIGVLQLDSVNVFARSHYLPAMARLGPYSTSELDRAVFSGDGRFVEYWAHEAAAIPVADWPLWHWKMARLRARDANHDWVQANGPMLDWLRAYLADHGPTRAGAIEHEANHRRGPWWGHSDVKRGLEFLFDWGEATTAGRQGFERVYAWAEHTLPAEVLTTEIAERDARSELMRRASTLLGVGTRADLADYFRLKGADLEGILADLVDTGELEPIRVEGWSRPAFRHRGATAARRGQHDALLTPFDPLVWDRDRAERHFDFEYRIEIYTPAHRRRFGYYSLPVLLGETIAGRIDLKADRAGRRLLVQSAWSEPTFAAIPDAVDRVDALLTQAARWSGLEEIVVADWGDLAPVLWRGTLDER